MNPKKSEEIRRNSLTPAQRKALPLLAAGLNQVGVSRVVGVRESTVSFWVNQDDLFASQLELARSQMQSQALDQLSSALTLAVDEVKNLLANAKNESVKLKAAEFVIGNVLEARKMTAIATVNGAGRANQTSLGQFLVELGVQND